jgi:N-succinyldiaminopimelate aminotransferase
VAPGHEHLTRRLQPFTTTIFATMSELAAATGSVNLGQGFPDTDGPEELREVAVDAIRQGRNQYPPGNGVPELRQAIAAHQRAWYGLDLHPDTDVLVTVGATEAVAATLLALCEPGDEVVMFEPTYDSYAAGVAMAGAVPRLVRLHPPDWHFDPGELAAAVGPRTKLILLNSPHNPTGKVFDRSELELIAGVCRDHDLIAVTDEVYEHLVFDGEHLPLAGFDGMAERTVTISSGGKTFSVTGWKIGWACASAPLIAAVQTAKQFLTFAGGTPFQHAIAAGLGLPDDRLHRLSDELRTRRDLLCDGMSALGFDVLSPASGYFATADVASIGAGDAAAFCAQLPERCGVVAIPSHVFYDHQDDARSLVRWAFCKSTSTLQEALLRLAKLV